MRPNDATTLLRAMRTAADATPDDVDLERILQAPPEAAPRPRRGYVRPVAVAGSLAVAATAAVALAPGGRDEVPGILDRAAAAISTPDTILHVKATLSGYGTRRTMESWQTTDGRRERVIFDGGALESAEDQDARTLRTYDRQRDTIVDHTDPGFFDDAHAHPVGLAGGNDLMGVTTIGDLAELLRRAKDGDGNASLVGETTIDGTPVQHVRITGSTTVADAPTDGGDPRDAPTRQVPVARDVYLSDATALPVRVVDRGPAPARDRTVTFQETRRLPRNAATDRLLRLGSHPGAATTDEGPVR